MANPRKFSEKIALQKQKQAEGTAEFEKIMNEVKATRVVDGVLGNTDLSDVGNLQRNASLSGGSGGSGTSSGASGGGASPDANAGGGGGIAGGGGGISVNSSTGSPAAYRESRGRSVGVGPMRRPSERKQDRSPYGSTASGLMLSGIIPNNSYLSPPMDTSWRRSNSDSALHQTLNMVEGNFVTTSPVPGMMGDLNSLHANYHHHHHHNNQRSHSPNIGRSYSPQAQRRKNTLLHQQQQQHQMQQQQGHHQQQQQLQHQRLQMQQAQHQQQQQHHQQQHLQQHLQNQQQTIQQQQLQQQQQQYNAKFNNSNIIFKSLQEQQLGFNNTGSLPDLTSVHYATQSNNTTTQMMQPSSQQQQQQQQTLSPILSPHHNNGCHDRDQSPIPFSPASTTGGGSGSGGGPPSPYHQQQNSPTSAANTPTAANTQTSPHLSFTNLAVQSPVNVQQTTAQNTAAAFSTLPTLGATSSAGNLTDYRQPLNPPSPGSSPGLLTSGPANDIHISAPPSPIRHCQNNLNSSTTGNRGPAQVGQAQQQQQMATQSLQNAFGAIDSNAGYNTLNPAFHNHFEQFNLGDSSQSPQNTYEALEFEDFGVVTSTSNQQQQHNTFNSKIIDFADLTSTSSSSSSNNTRTNNTNTTTNCNNNNNNLPRVQQQQQQQQHQRNNSQQFQQQQQHINNNSTTNTSSSNAHTNGPVTSRTHNRGFMNNNDRQDILSSNSSPIPSPLSHCVPSPSSPLPIPMSGHSPSNQQQLSLSVQTSPHHSPMHSPHHSPSPLSVSSPGLTMLGGSISPVPSPSTHIMQQHNLVNNQTATQMHHNQTSQAANQHHHHHNQQQQQTHTPCNTTTNIPQIIFSDYSSSRDIFENLDLDLEQIDEPGLQMLSDQSPIMIADPSIEDSFRRDLN